MWDMIFDLMRNISRTNITLFHYVNKLHTNIDRFSQLLLHIANALRDFLPKKNLNIYRSYISLSYYYHTELT